MGILLPGDGGQVTTMDAALDPLADKLMVSWRLLIILRPIMPNIVPPWIAIVVIGREFLVPWTAIDTGGVGFTIQASEIGQASRRPPDCPRVAQAIPAHSQAAWNWFGFTIGSPLHRGDGAGHHDCGLDHLGRRLLCRILEEDRPRVECTPEAAGPP